MICSACGYENQVGNRFCGMCGTPLPHPPLTAPGAHGTHTFTRVPLESAQPGRDGVRSAAEKPNAEAPPSRSGVSIKMPGVEPQPVRSSDASPPDMVPEISLDEYIKKFRYVPPADPDEITMRGETQVLRAEAPAVGDVPATVLPEITSAADSDPISATEDIDERLGLGESTPDNESRDRPRFLDFNEPAPPLEKPEAPVPAIVGPSFLGVGDKPLVAALSPDSMEAAKPRGRVWTWVAVAALLGFVSLGVLEWRSQVNRTNGPVEVVKMKLRNIWPGSRQAPEERGSAEANAANPAAQVEEQPKQQPQDQSTTRSPNAPNPAANNPTASDANPAGNAASSPQSTSTVPGTQPPVAQRTVSPTPRASVDPEQSATGQKATQPKVTPPNSSKAVTASENVDAVQTSSAKPKPKAQAGQEGDPEIPVKKLVPGQEELAKANDASDAAAAAAWLWKATAKGNPDAPVRLADMYIKGDGVPHSCEQALVLLRAAADKGSTQARARLAQMNNSGACAQRTR